MTLSKWIFLSSKKIPHVDGLSRLIPEIRERLQVTVIASLSSEMDIKNIRYNTVKDLPVTLEKNKVQSKIW